MNHFLLQRPDGTYFYLYHDKKNNGLSLKRYGKKGVGNNNSTLLRQNVEPHFSCTTDPHGRIHVAFSTTNGGIHYGYFTENTFRSFPILTSKSPMLYPKHLCILAEWEPVTIFYLVRHEGKTILSMQQVDSKENTSTAPVAIDYLWHPEQNFAACQEETGTIYLAYTRALSESEKGAHVIRVLNSNGAVQRQQEILTDCKEPLWMDHFEFDKDNRLTLLSHAASYASLYFCTVEEKISQTEIDLTSYPRTKSTFFGLIELQGKTHCYFCTENVLYDCILRGGSSSIAPQKQTKQYNSTIVPICCICNHMPGNVKQLCLPGTLAERQFFYLFNPFTDEKSLTESLDLTRLSALEKRISTLEQQVAHLEETIRIPRDVVGRNFDT